MTMTIEAAAQTLREAARNCEEVFDLVSRTRRPDGYRRDRRIALPFCIVGRLVLFLGWILIISGIVQGISLIRRAKRAKLLASIGVGCPVNNCRVLFLRRPEECVVTLALLLIVFFMVEGFAKIVFSLTIRPLPNWGWVLASGIVGILLSFYLLANLTTTAVWLLGVLLGIQLICEGVALSSLAWRVRRSA
jgi:uncharacterized membrane protein HdeD (DUF308 family)